MKGYLLILLLISLLLPIKTLSEDERLIPFWQVPEKKRNYYETLKPAPVYKDRDYVELFGLENLEIKKQCGAVFHFDPENDPLLRNAGIIIGNAARYTHLRRYQEYLLSSDKPALVYVGSADVLGYGVYSLQNIHPPARICADPQAEREEPWTFFNRPAWRDLERKMHDRFIGFSYVEGCWIFRPAGHPRFNISVNRYHLKQPETPEDYYHHYANLYRILNTSLGANGKLITISANTSGIFLPVKLGAPASAFYMYEGHNLSRLLAYARGAARQYGKPILVYFAHYPVAGSITNELEMDIPINEYEGDPHLIQKIRDTGRLLLEGKGIFLTAGPRMHDRPDYLLARVSKGALEISGPRCDIPLCLYRRICYFNFLSGVGIVEPEHEPLLSFFNSEGSKAENIRFSYRKDGEQFDIDGHTSLETIEPGYRKKYVEPYLGKDLYLSPYALVKREIVLFHKKHGRGALFTPVAYMIEPLYDVYAPHYLRRKLEDSAELEKMLLAWETWSFGNDPHVYKRIDYRKTKNLFQVRKLSEIELDTNNLKQRKEINDMLTADVSEQTLNVYPAVVTVGPVSEKTIPKLKRYAEQGGTWVVNVDQLSTEEWTRLFGIKMKLNHDEGDRWKNMRTGVEFREATGKYHYAKAEGLPGEVLLRNGKNDDPLAVAMRLGCGRIVVMLEHACLLHGQNCGAAWQDARGISHTLDAMNEILAEELLPVSVTANVQSLYNLMEDGWMVTLINNLGVSQPLGKSAEIFPEYRAEVTIRFKWEPQNLIELLEGKSLAVDEEDGVYSAEICVPPGEIRILRFAYAERKLK